MRKKAINIALTTMLLLTTLSIFAYASDPGHLASSISPGTFEAGNFTFPEDLTVVNKIYAGDWSNVSITGSQGESLSWSKLENYPSNCSAREFVFGLGDTLYCSAPSGTAVESDPYWTANQSSYWNISDITSRYYNKSDS